MTTQAESSTQVTYAHTMFGGTRHIVKDAETLMAHCGNFCDPGKSVNPTAPICERCLYSVNYTYHAIPDSPRRRSVPRRRKAVQWAVTLADGFVCYTSTAKDGEKRAAEVAARHDGAVVSSSQIMETY